MKKKVMILVTCGFFGALNCSSESIENMTYKVVAGKRADLTKADLPAGFENEVLAQLRKIHFIADLIRLNDQVTIDKVIQQYKEVQGKDTALRNALENCCAPWILDELAPLLYEEDSLNPRSWHDSFGVSWDVGYSMSVAEVMTTIVGKSPEFSDEVRKTATASNPYPYHCIDPMRIALMRNWWKLNKDAILAERFAEVGPISLDIVPVDSLEELKERYKVWLSKGNTNQATSVSEITSTVTNYAASQPVRNSNEVSSVKSGPEPTEKIAEKSSYTLGLILFAITLSGVFCFLKLRPFRNKGDNF